MTKLVILAGGLLLLELSQQPAVKPSQHGTVTQQVAGTTITVDYNRPVARGRDLFGALVPAHHRAEAKVPPDAGDWPCPAVPPLGDAGHRGEAAMRQTEGPVVVGIDGTLPSAAADMAASPPRLPRCMSEMLMPAVPRTVPTIPTMPGVSSLRTTSM